MLRSKIYLIFSSLLITFSVLSLSCSDELPSEPKTDSPYIKKPISVSLSIDDRVEELLQQMTLEEKVGQMTQIDNSTIRNNPGIIRDYYLGSVLNGGGSGANPPTPENFAIMYDQYQSLALETRLQIPMIYGVDAVHGHNNVYGAVIFPHNIGLGCTNNPTLIEEAARITAIEVAATGIDWTFAPCIAVPRDERWGRTYEGFSETPDLTEQMSDAAVRGFQGTDLSANTTILACAKHYVADGGTYGGTDQGNAFMDEETLRAIHLPGYIAAINAGVGSIMASFSSWNGQKMHGHKYLLTDVLKTELGFEGFIVSDWAGIDQLPGDYKSDIELSINAGIDMVMVPHNYEDFITLLIELVNENKVSMDRINDAVRRILKQKFALGLFEHPYANSELLGIVGSESHREVARECVRQSCVLLKNSDDLLPLRKDINTVLVSGKNADNIGAQCGGWTISWQGNRGDITIGTTILEGIEETVSNNTTVIFSEDGSNSGNSDVAIVVVGESPYAEGAGDRGDLSLASEDVELIQKLKQDGMKVVMVLISGRPMIINEVLDDCDAIVAAWLPGTEGQGVADVLFGDYNPTGRLTHSWPKSMGDIPINYGDTQYDPLFEYGYGLQYSSVGLHDDH